MAADTTRRALFAGAAGLGAAAIALPVVARPPAPAHGDRFKLWASEFERLTEAGSQASRDASSAGRPVADCDAAAEHFWDQRDVFEDAILLTPPADHAGAVVKLRHVHGVLDGYSGVHADGPEQHCVAQVIAFLERGL